MLGEEKSTEGPFHINCRIHLHPHDFHDKDQLEFTIEQFLQAFNGKGLIEFCVTQCL